MVLNDSFLALFSSPASLKKANDSFNESFGDKNTLSPATIFISLQKEHEHISSVLRFHPLTTLQYQSSLNELISLFDRSEELSTIGLQKLILSVFLKLAANILTVLGKPKYQPTLHKLAQLIAESIVPDLGAENEIENRNLKKWADRVVIECSIDLLEFPNFALDLEFCVENIIDDLMLADGRFQFVKSSIFIAARRMVLETNIDITMKINPESKFTLENLEDEHFLRLLLWLFLRQKTFLKSDRLPSLFSKFPLAFNVQKYFESSECSLIDVKLFLVSLSVVASTTTESGTTMKSAPIVASQLSLTKHQKDCWKAMVNTCDGKSVAAISRLRASQLVETVRLISDSSEDVRVLFETWKHCLQLSATYDDDVSEAILLTTKKYKEKMNSLLAYGPFYSSLPQSTSSTRRDRKTLFPLQFDYEFVNTTEAEHIGTVINSLEGYMSPQPKDELSDSEGEILPAPDNESFGDDIFHSFVSSNCSTHNSEFFSPLKYNRDSIVPCAISQLIRDESLATASHISTKSVILTPVRDSPKQNSLSELSFERQQNVNITTPSKGIIVNSESGNSENEDEEDELEEALRESTKKHEQSILAQKTPEKPTFVSKCSRAMKDAQTETDGAVTSSEESSIISVVYTPKAEAKKKPVPSYSSESEEYDEDEEYDENDDYDEYEEESENEDSDVLNESQMEDMIVQILEATSAMFRDRRMKQFGIESQKILVDCSTDDEILRQAELKLATITKDLNISFKKLEMLGTAGAAAASPSEINAFNPIDEKGDPDSEKCLGSQSDEIQESALRRLEQMASEWNAEGNNYLYK